MISFPKGSGGGELMLVCVYRLIDACFYGSFWIRGGSRFLCGKGPGAYGICEAFDGCGREGGYC